MKGPTILEALSRVGAHARSTWVEFAKLKRSAQDRADDCYWHGRRYRYSYLRWDRRAQRLLLGGAVASFLASAALLTNLAKSQPSLAVALGIASLLAGLLQLLYSVTDARKRADDYGQGERANRLMRWHYLRFVETWDDREAAATKLDELMEEEERLQLPRPLEGWTHARVMKDGAAGERP
jgi:hypothetical protein